MIVYPTDTGPAINWHTAEWENRGHLVASAFTTGAYVIEHVASGSVYVGGSMNMPQRWRIHIKQLRAGKHYNKPLQADWARYGAGGRDG